MNRNRLKKHVNDWITRLGSQEKVSQKCGISKTALSLWMSGKYGAETTNLENKIAVALNYRESDWVVVESVKNYRTIRFVFGQCRAMHLWMAISSNAGSGKTQCLEHLYNNDLSGSVIFLQAEEWAAHQFLIRLYEKLSTTPLKNGYMTNSEIQDKVISLFNQMENPILIIDEADKLKPSALRRLIPIYNRTEERLGCILSGTENLEKEIKAGVRKHTKGYDEIDSRLGRSYISLDGLTEKDVYAICEANGLTDEDAKVTVWSESDKTEKVVKVKTPQGIKDKAVLHCEDLRRLKRLIIREKLMTKVKV